MGTFLISYIEDNELGVYQKEILVESANFITCVREYSLKYPTINSCRQLHGDIEQRWRDFFSHESQDAIQRGKRGLDELTEKTGEVEKH